MREIDTSTVGGRIKVARIKRGYSQEKLAELLHVTPVQISNYENNRNDIKVRVIKELAEKLEVSVSYLVDESGGEFEDDVYELIDIFKRLGSKRDKKIAVEQLKVLLNVI